MEKNYILIPCFFFLSIDPRARSLLCSWWYGGWFSAGVLRKTLDEKKCLSLSLSVFLLVQFVDMRLWRLVTADHDEVPSVLNSLSNTVVADVQELPASVLQLHWVLPQSYLGDRVRTSAVTHTHIYCRATSRAKDSSPVLYYPVDRILCSKGPGTNQLYNRVFISGESLHTTAVHINTQRLVNMRVCLQVWSRLPLYDLCFSFLSSPTPFHYSTGLL